MEGTCVKFVFFNSLQTWKPLETTNNKKYQFFSGHIRHHTRAVKVFNGAKIKMLCVSGDVLLDLASFR